MIKQEVYNVRFGEHTISITYGIWKPSNGKEFFFEICDCDHFGHYFDFGHYHELHPLTKIENLKYFLNCEKCPVEIKTVGEYFLNKLLEWEESQDPSKWPTVNNIKDIDIRALLAAGILSY